MQHIFKKPDKRIITYLVKLVSFENLRVTYVKIQILIFLDLFWSKDNVYIQRETLNANLKKNVHFNALTDKWSM